MKERRDSREVIPLKRPQSLVSQIWRARSLARDPAANARLLIAYRDKRSRVDDYAIAKSAGRESGIERRF